MKADRIKKLLDDEDLKEAFSQVRDAIHRGWANTPPTKQDEKEEWHRRLFSIDSVEANLRRAIQDGVLEDFRTTEKERLPFLGDIQAWRKKRASKTG